MDRECSVNAMSRALIVVGIALVVFSLAQPGVAYQGSVYNRGFPVTAKLGGDLVERTGNNTSFRNPSVVGELRFVSMKALEKKEKVIEGVGRLQWGKGQENTFMGALAITMDAIGEDITYDYLMGVSGAAFRVQVHNPDWCPSAPDAGCGFNCADVALSALGYKVRGIHSSSSKPEDVQKVREAVVRSIDNGYPVIAIDLINSPDYGVIVGYENDGKEFLCRTYYDKTDEYSPAEKWPWIVTIIEGKDKTPDRRKNILHSLELAVMLANTEKFEDYTSGFNAYETWVTDLLDDPRFEEADKGKSGEMTHANAWTYNSLVDARAAAVRYLRSISEDLGQESAKHISEAADIYEEALGKLKDGWKYAPFPHDLKGGEGWTAEMRHAEADVLKEVSALEKKAVNELKAAIEKASEASEQAKGEKVIIDGLDEYRVIDAMFEGVRIVMSHRGEEYSPAYIQGISGGSFRIAGICPCAPTSNNAMGPQELIELLGYDMEYLPLSGDGINPEERIKDTLPRIKSEIRAGRPAIVWHAFTNAEWDVVCGFDDEKKQFIGRGSYVGSKGEYATADENRTIKCEHICDPLGAILIGEKTGEFDARAAELAALKEAVRHARSRENEDKLGGDKWVMLEGILCYDRWISDFKNDPEKTRGAGDAYCYGIYKSTHRTASEFLNEIAPRYPEASENLRSAATHFAAEADVLDQGEELLWWNSPQGPDLERNAKAAELLARARDSYVNGIDEIERALKTIEK